MSSPWRCACRTRRGARSALPALPDGPVPFSWGTLVLVAIVGAGMLLVPRALRWIIEHTLMSALAFTALSLLLIFAARRLSGTAFTLPAWLPVLVGLAGLAASVVLTRRVIAQDRAVRDPLTAEDRFASRGSRLLQTLTPWLFVLVTAFNAAVVLAVR